MKLKLLYISICKETTTSLFINIITSLCKYLYVTRDWSPFQRQNTPISSPVITATVLQNGFPFFGLLTFLVEVQDSEEEYDYYSLKKLKNTIILAYIQEPQGIFFRKPELL